MNTEEKNKTKKFRISISVISFAPKKRKVFLNSKRILIWFNFNNDKIFCSLEWGIKL